LAVRFFWRAAEQAGGPGHRLNEDIEVYNQLFFWFFMQPFASRAARVGKKKAVSIIETAF
jgi:hypothetical protein